ncbi:hypothetical protein RUND412_011079 [Rhizina undulata]
MDFGLMCVYLMNYCYIPSSPYPFPPTNGSSSSTSDAGPLIIMTTGPSTKKTLNLTSNPRVSLLVHDWALHRPSVYSTNPFSSSPPNATKIPASTSPQQTSGLAAFLTNLNSAALSSISATLY